MLPDLQVLIDLQKLESTAEDTRRTLEAIPSRLEALKTSISARNDAVTIAREQLDETRLARRANENDLAIVQTRLSTFKDRLMAVKTNKEYQAIQKEIATAQEEARSLEDQTLERMLEIDDRAATAAETERTLVSEKAASLQAQEALDNERNVLEHQLEQSTWVRSRLVKGLTPKALAMFEHVASQRQGVAVVEARTGHCSFCNVRLRPQVFNNVRLNQSLIQCDSCLRILYYMPV